MDAIPMPQLLDPTRIIDPERDDMTLDEHRSRASTFKTALDRTCEYGRGLHEELAAVREYLAAHVPTDSADTQAWASWCEMYGSVTSSLAGPSGDDGFGAQEAAVIAEKHGAAGLPG